ncbi:MAG: hypothetical protein IJ047_04280 [Paludibacteraceae bacterium]|nr:hypothetical protein [Paludibacteraceae bacterium]
MKLSRLTIYVVTFLMGLLCGCKSNCITITYEIGDICITRQMYPRYSILSYSSGTCAEAGQIYIEEKKGEYEAVLTFDTCQNIVFVASKSTTKLIPKHIDTTVWRVQAPNIFAYSELYGEQQIAYLDYRLRLEIYNNSGFNHFRRSRQNTNWQICYPKQSKWNLTDFGYIGGLQHPSSIIPNADDSIHVLRFVEDKLKEVQYVSFSHYKHDCSLANVGYQLFHVYYECSTGNGEIVLVKDSANNIIDHLNIVLQSTDYQSHTRVNSSEYYLIVSTEETKIRSECHCGRSEDTIVTRTQYDLINGHYISHPVKDIMVFENNK